MRQLVLMRHAKAAPGEDEVDFTRPLADRGRAEAPRIAHALVDAGAAPDVALVSDARRCRETWELAKPDFPKCDVRFLKSLYLAPPEILMAEAIATGAERVLVLAHNPGVHELAQELVTERSRAAERLRLKMPPAGAAVFDRRADDAPWALVAFLTPELI